MEPAHTGHRDDRVAETMNARVIHSAYERCDSARHSARRGVVGYLLRIAEFRREKRLVALGRIGRCDQPILVRGVPVARAIFRLAFVMPTARNPANADNSGRSAGIAVVPSRPDCLADQPPPNNATDPYRLSRTLRVCLSPDPMGGRRIVSCLCTGWRMEQRLSISAVCARRQLFRWRVGHDRSGIPGLCRNQGR